MDQIDQAILTDILEKLGLKLKTYVKKRTETNVVEHLNHLSVSWYKQYKCLLKNHDDVCISIEVEILKSYNFRTQNFEKL